jgi:hypothetical protein
MITKCDHLSAIKSSSLMILLALILSLPAQAEEPVDTSVQKFIVGDAQFEEAMKGATESVIGREKFVSLQEEGNVAILDVRDRVSFEKEHIKGSINIPLDRITEKTLPQALPDKGTRVILVCENSFYPTRMIALTTQAYPVMKVNGYGNVYQLNLWRDNPPPDGNYTRGLAREGSAVKKTP